MSSILYDLFNMAEKKYGFDKTIEMLSYLAKPNQNIQPDINLNIKFTNIGLDNGKKEY